MARRKVAGRRNSLPTLYRLVAGGSAPIARYPWVRVRVRLWRWYQRSLYTLICQESQEESLKLLFRDMDFLPKGGCDDVITGRFGVAGSLRHRNKFFCKA